MVGCQTGRAVGAAGGATVPPTNVTPSLNSASTSHGGKHKLSFELQS